MATFARYSSLNPSVKTKSISPFAEVAISGSEAYHTRAAGFTLECVAFSARRVARTLDWKSRSSTHRVTLGVASLTAIAAVWDISYTNSRGQSYNSRREGPDSKMTNGENMPLSVSSAAPSAPTVAPIASRVSSRHSALVRVTHWIITLSFFALLVSGMEIVISHPRFYWGESGTVNDKAWLQLPIPSSRDLVKTGYGYVMPDQNGWSRYLHFEAAWVAVLTALLYGIYGVLSGHFRKNLLPSKADLSMRGFLSSIGKHLRFARGGPEEARQYNLLQRLSYLAVIFILFPLEIWTGLAMSPSFAGAFPMSVILLGGRQSARTLHFFISLALLLFVVIHVVMICVSGFRNRMRAMITGGGSDLEQP